MARTYHAGVARHAAVVDPKWLDNVLSHFEVPGVSGGRQGTPRRITETGVRHIVLISRLSGSLGVRNVDAVSLARRLLAGPPSIQLAGGCLALLFDRALFEREVAQLLEDAVEAVAPAPRGRPRIR